MDFDSIENKDGIRMSWNCIGPFLSPSAYSKPEIPFAILYRPRHDIQIMNQLKYDPLFCKCKAILNPFITLENNKWKCPFCNCLNEFPENYAKPIAEGKIPIEMNENSSTVEFIKSIEKKDILFLFIIDLCIEKPEFEAIKQSIIDIIDFFPNDAYIGLISFSRNIYLHELRNNGMHKS